MENIKKQNINGFIVIDKPAGPTSHQIDSWVRDITGEKRVGHIGTLDPNVSGVLVMALGKATKLIDLVHEKPKEYISIMRLYSNVPEYDIHHVFDEFTGKIYQLPPVRSAVARELRIRTIYNMDIIEIKDKLILFHVKCESGTYIRTLCTDMGYVIGTGAQMADLRRISTGDFKEDMVHSLQELSDAVILKNKGKPELFNELLLPMDFVFRDYPKIIVKKTAIKNIKNGSDIYPPGIITLIGKPVKGDKIAIYTEKNDLIAYGTMLVNEIKDLKVVDIDNVLVGGDEDNGKNIMVRGKNKRENIPVQKFRKELHGNFQHVKERNKAGNRKRTFEKHSRPERNTSKIRKGKNK